jgi:hypothetical protein
MTRCYTLPHILLLYSCSYALSVHHIPFSLSQLFDRENLATSLDDLLFISSDTAGNLGQFLELNKLSEILLVHRQINFKAEEKSHFTGSGRDSDSHTNSAVHCNIFPGLEEEEKGDEEENEKGKGNHGVEHSAGGRMVDEGESEGRGGENDNKEGSCNEGVSDRRGKGLEVEEKYHNEGGMLLAVGECAQRGEEDQEDQEEEEDYRIVEGIAEGATDACALFITAVRKDYPGYLFLRPDLYTAVSDPCLQVRHRRGGDRREGRGKE